MIGYYNEFIKRMPDGWSPKNPEIYIERVESCHKELRSILGGSFKTKDTDIQLPQATNPYANEMSQIRRIIPRYFEDSDLRELDVIGGKIKSRRNMSVVKHITAYAKRKKVKPKQIFDIVKILQKVSDHVKTIAKLDEDIYCFTVDTRPTSFMSLGMFHFDTYSCMAQNNFNSHHKYLLGCYQNSFIGFLHKKDLDISNPLFIDDPKKVFGRVVGFYTPKNIVYINGTFLNDLDPGIETILKKYFQEFIPSLRENYKFDYYDAEKAFKLSGGLIQHQTRSMPLRYWHQPAGILHDGTFKNGGIDFEEVLKYINGT